MDILKKNSTVVYLLVALIVIVVIGFWFSKPQLVNSSTAAKSDVKKVKPSTPSNPKEEDETKK